MFMEKIVTVRKFNFFGKPLSVFREMGLQPSITSDLGSNYCISLEDL